MALNPQERREARLFDLKVALYDEAHLAALLKLTAMEGHPALSLADRLAARRRDLRAKEAVWETCVSVEDCIETTDGEPRC